MVHQSVHPVITSSYNDVSNKSLVFSVWAADVSCRVSAGTFCYKISCLYDFLAMS